MPTLTLTIGSADKEYGVPPKMMKAVILKLLEAGLLPLESFRVVMSAQDDDAAAELEATITAALEDRSAIIAANLEIKTKRGIARKIVDQKPEPTPLELAIAKASMA